MSWLTIIRHCPRCGAAQSARATGPFHCSACALDLFANPGVGVGIFASDVQGRVLFVRRAKEPGKGLLGLPGGFVDAGETAEAALNREISEEIGGTLATCTFLCSAPNFYMYADVPYDVLDLFFAGTLAPGDFQIDAGEIAACVWREPASVRDDEFAFPSTRNAWHVYRSRV
ncbi:MAG: NUDIX domain-containing protein [Planctomycetota bacterium]